MRNWNSNVPLGGMKNCVAAMENSMVVTQKTENKSTTLPTNFTSEHIPKGIKSQALKK